MKKRVLYIFLGIIYLLYFTDDVKADGSCSCYYGTDSVGIIVNVTDSGAPEVTKAGTQSTYINLSTNNLSVTNFKDTTNKVWKCPSTIYYTIVSGGRSVTYNDIGVTKPSSGNIGNSSLVSNKSSDGTPYESSSTNSNDINCVYGNLTLTIDNNNNKINGSNAGCSSITLPSYDTLSDKTQCPKEIYGFRYAVPRTSGFTCSYSWKSATSYSRIELNGKEPVYDANGDDVSNGENKTRVTRDTESELYTGCPLGEDVTKDLYGALKIFKIAAPLLVIGFTIFEFVQALAKGDITAELKKLSQRLLKRCIYAVILFFLPVLVNQVMQLANVWDENGTCDFSNSVEVNPDENNQDSYNEQEQTGYCTAACSTSSEYNKCLNTCKNCVSGCQKAYANDKDKFNSCVNVCIK